MVVGHLYNERGRSHCIACPASVYGIQGPEWPVGEGPTETSLTVAPQHSTPSRSPRRTSFTINHHLQCCTLDIFRVGDRSNNSYETSMSRRLTPGAPSHRAQLWPTLLYSGNTTTAWPFHKRSQHPQLRMVDNAIEDGDGCRVRQLVQISQPDNRAATIRSPGLPFACSLHSLAFDWVMKILHS